MTIKIYLSIVLMIFLMFHLNSKQKIGYFIRTWEERDSTIKIALKVCQIKPLLCGQNYFQHKKLLMRIVI